MGNLLGHGYCGVSNRDYERASDWKQSANDRGRAGWGER
jgi:hypothetical protein